MTMYRVSITGRRMAGFSLVEIMVALVISLFILGGAVTILIQNQQHYRQNDDFGRLQENARFAMDTIVEDLRMAGFFGCSTQVKNNLNFTAGDLVDTTRAIDGYEEGEAAWEAQGSTAVVASIWPGTDAITIRKLRNRGVPILADMATADAVVNINNAPVNSGQLAAIYNCGSTDIFQVTSSDTAANTLGHVDGGAFAPGNAVADFSGTYQQNAVYTANPTADPQGLSSRTFVTAYEPVRYFVAASTADPARPALWRQTHDGSSLATQELIEGIENMQILYGVDNNSDGSPDAYVDADAVGNWNRVVGVKATLLVSTIEETGLDVDTKTYDVYSTPANAGDDVGPFNDRRSRKLVSATVLLRNLQLKL